VARTSVESQITNVTSGDVFSQLELWVELLARVAENGSILTGGSIRKMAF
jgi:hypothetical protein